MVDILHKVGVKSSSLDSAYQALTTIKGLSGWWTSDTRGESKAGGIIQFRFGAGGFDMKVLELDPQRRVEWLVVDGPPEWLGTKVIFELRQEAERPLAATLTSFLRNKSLMLIFDNCEHVVDAVAQLAATVMRLCPHLTIVTTSREVLRIEGEYAEATPGLMHQSEHFENARARAIEELEKKHAFERG